MRLLVFSSATFLLSKKIIFKGLITMDNSIKETLKPFLMEYVKEITPQSKTSPYQFVCPFCGSGLGTHQTGAFTVYPETNSYHCFACGVSGDIFNLYGEINKLKPRADKNVPITNKLNF